MNNILQLKGRFDTEKNKNKPGSPKLPKGKSVTTKHINKLEKQLSKILNYWIKNKDIGGALVSVHYTHIVAKSNRLKIILSQNSKEPSESIRGVKFVWDNNIQKHVFTHFVSLDTLQKSINLLKDVSSIIDTRYNGIITSEIYEDIITNKKYSNVKVAKSNFLKTVVDSYYVESFDIDHAEEEITEESIITIYQTGVETKKLLSKFGIEINESQMIDKTTLRLNPDEIKLLYNNASYLIAMSVTDFCKITKEDVYEQALSEDYFVSIPKPTNEPIVGVIDTHFNTEVYFSEWVEYHNMLDPNITIEEIDKKHGTAISSIIVDGPRGNPNLEDGCGHFRVRHFGVATHNGFSSFTILKLIRNIVAQNRDIKVWNLSLGSRLEIKQNFISCEAAELDRIQNEFDVLFVVAGTNKNPNEKKETKIGAPADSLNSIVVNSVSFSEKPASYTRVGPVLSFFNKPDISYYGGDGIKPEEKIIVCSDVFGQSYVSGTSYAAPWITRKLAYLIHIMGMSKEVAKALLIDSAAGWNNTPSYKTGYGIVPKHIHDILYTPNDEIKFILSGTSEEYETYTYNLPVPLVEDKHPYYAKATLVYFSQCDRAKGVDYTNTEMDIHFGRVKSKNGRTTIDSINNNLQSEDENITLYEENARKMYRKWDNVKHISETIKNHAVPRKSYGDGLWGLSIKTKERNSTQKKQPLQFGVVITLKEMNGINRIDSFIKNCQVRSWLVTKLNIENQIDIYTKAEEEIEFE